MAVTSAAARQLYLLSGLPPGPGGTGRLVGYLRRRARETGVALRLVARRPPWREVARLMRRRDWHSIGGHLLGAPQGSVGFARALARIAADPEAPLVLLHPQTIGFERSLALLRARTRPAVLLLLDSSFFCIASYDHVAGERGPCHRCAGGGFEAIEHHGCRPYPVADPAALTWCRELPALARAGAVRIVAQNRRQAELAALHLGLPAPPPVAGLWAEDWEAVVGERQDRDARDPPAWDVVFHGYAVEAKGVRFMQEVAALLGERSFLFPCERPARARAGVFRPMTWETGLAEAVRASRLTVVPSLWSAPLEGALVKSLLVGRGTAVVRNSAAYSDELPEGLLLRLSPEPARAAAEIELALRSGFATDPALLEAWRAELTRMRETLFDGLLSAATD